MRKYIKPVVLMALVIGILVALSISASAKETYSYAVKNGEVTIVSYVGTETWPTIPESINGYPVTCIGTMAFSGSDIENIDIPDSITKIEGMAFYNCENLRWVTIPDKVTSIGNWAFYNCISLTNVTIGDNVTNIGENAFCDCVSLADITIGDNVTSIGKGAFRGCWDLRSITIPDKVKTIGDEAFYACMYLKNVTIGKNVTSIGDSAFEGCMFSLESITIPESVKSIGNTAFKKCEKLTEITISQSVVSIGNNAFEECKKLSNIYYLGTNVEWQKISIGSGNDYLALAKLHCRVVATGIELNKKTAELRVGETEIIIATVLPTDAENKEVIWKSSDSSVATVDNGVVTAIGSGSATITAITAVGGYYDICEVKVVVPVTGVMLDQTSATINNDETLFLTAIVLPENATNSEVIWSSSDDSVVSVQNGVVTLIGGGTATITATTADGGYTATCEVVAEDLNTLFDARVYTETVKSATQGSTFNYTIYLAGTYDGFALEVASSEDISITDVVVANDQVDVNKRGDRWVISTIGGFEKTKSPKFEIATVTVLVDEDAEPEPEELALAKVSISDEFGRKVKNLKYVYANIEITEYTPGDINGDGNVTARDVTALRKYIVGGYPDNKVVEATLDVDRNGSVTARDVTRLRQFIVGGYGITLK